MEFPCRTSGLSRSIRTRSILSWRPLALTYFVALRLVHSRFGRALIAVRENELAASASGINPLRQKAAAFIYGSASAGLAGALYAHYASYINPELFGFTTSVQMVVMVVIGGLGSMAGAIIGALVIVLLPEFLRAFADYRLVIYGGLIIAFMLFLPGGLADIGRRSIRIAALRRDRRARRLTDRYGRP
jgi:branched-chain amino acid transport system permease protein